MLSCVVLKKTPEALFDLQVVVDLPYIKLLDAELDSNKFCHRRAAVSQKKKKRMALLVGV